jgi:predicted metal-dependent HD superfamily phosphohydrolase
VLLNETMLRATWHECVGGHPRAAAAFDELIARYSEPHRRYHGLAHLRRVVRDVGVLLPSVDLDIHPALVRLAALFHDAVYDPTRHDNEFASAQLARRVLGELGVSPGALDEVERLIMTTVDHAASDPAAAVLADADLAVLGADWTTYQVYVSGVRAEYSHVDDATWRVGRPAVLRRFLDRPAIYRTEPMQSREAQARSNLADEIRMLSAVGET